jgi:hypothetical protein
VWAVYYKQIRKSEQRPPSQHQRLAVLLGTLPHTLKVKDHKEWILWSGICGAGFVQVRPTVHIDG